MGRDFTPREQIRNDILFNGILSSQKLTVSYGGREEVVYDPKSELCTKYPHLSFLAGQVLSRCMREGIPESVLMEIEKTLHTVIQNDLTGIDTKDWAERPDTVEPLRTAARWYHGILDPDFHYNDENNNQLYNFIHTFGLSHSRGEER